MQRLKYEGWVGIREMEIINATYLIKHGSKIQTKLIDIWLKLVKARYFKNNNQNFLQKKDKLTLQCMKPILDHRNLRKGLLWFLEIETFDTIIG